jgi:opacity protein-like surface antigen
LGFLSDRLWGVIKQRRLTALVALLLISSPAQAGPPYRTDDPEPVEYQHWEHFTYSTGTHVKDDTGGDTPAIEFDYGIVPNGRVAIIAPMAFDRAVGEPFKWGYGDTQLEFKYRLIEQDKNGWRPSIGVVPSLELPSGDFRRSLGNGVTRVFLPMWLQKDFGDWTTYGGGGYWINHGRDNKNFWYVGWVLQRKITDKLAIGAELFHQTAEMIDKKDQTGFNVAAIYDFTENYHFLFSVGRGIQHAKETNQLSWYIGLQVTDTVEKQSEKAYTSSLAPHAEESSEKNARPHENATAATSMKREGVQKLSEMADGASPDTGGGERNFEKSTKSTKEATPKPLAGAFSWTGFYVGTGLGHLWQRATEADTICYVGPFISSYSLKGAVGGPFTGFNWQEGQLVVGLEADVEAVAAKGGESVTLVGLTQRHDVRGSARGRVGVAIDRALPYVTGGVALANFFPSALGEPFSRAQPGWTLGSGIEYALTDNWSARIEYRHSDFGASTYESANFDGNSYRIRIRDDVLRASVAYRFNFADHPPTAP